MEDLWLRIVNMEEIEESKKGNETRQMNEQFIWKVMDNIIYAILEESKSISSSTQSHFHLPTRKILKT